MQIGPLSLSGYMEREVSQPLIINVAHFHQVRAAVDTSEFPDYFARLQIQTSGINGHKCHILFVWGGHYHSHVWSPLHHSN